MSEGLGDKDLYTEEDGEVGSVVLSRKLYERVMVGGHDGIPLVIVKVLRIDRGRVRLAITAPKHVAVDREEVWQQRVQSE